MTPRSHPPTKHVPICLAILDQFSPVQVIPLRDVILGPGVGGWEGRLKESLTTPAKISLFLSGALQTPQAAERQVKPA